MQVSHETSSTGSGIIGIPTYVEMKFGVVVEARALSHCGRQIATGGSTEVTETSASGTVGFQGMPMPSSATAYLRRAVMLTMAAAVVTTSACSGSDHRPSTDSRQPSTSRAFDVQTAGPDGVARAFFDALQHGDGAQIAKVVTSTSVPPLAWYASMVKALAVTKTAFTVASPTIDSGGNTASVPIESNLVAAPFAPFVLHGSLLLSHSQLGWRVEWNPQSLDATFTTETHFKRSTDWPNRAPILGAHNQPLTTSVIVDTVSIEGSRIKDPAALSKALLITGATPTAIAAAIASAGQHPSWAIPIIDLPRAKYLVIKPRIYPIPGTVFSERAVRRPVSTDLARIIGTVGAVTREQLANLGPPYTDVSRVGRSGLEGAYERQLAGTPGGVLQAIDATGRVVKSLADIIAITGSPVRTTIDLATQAAADRALVGVPHESVIVAIRVSTGDILASASQPTNAEFNNAFAGHYPPGSTFKIISAADLLEHGLTPNSPLSCPGTLKVGSTVFHNFEQEALGPINLQQAFAASCNTAFMGATRTLPSASFSVTAKKFGIGVPLHLPVMAYAGNVPDPTTDVERAATTIGQARVSVSPLAMANVGATVASGIWREPQLVVSRTSDATTTTSTVEPIPPTRPPEERAPARPVDARVIAGLRLMMASVVTSGTAHNRGLPPGTSGKTGTAEFGTATPPQTHAWFVGFRGDIAFAVLVVDGGVGGEVAVPIAAKFLTSLGA